MGENPIGCRIPRSRKPTPARMCSADSAPCSVTHQHGKAVGNHHRAGQVFVLRDAGIGHRSMDRVRVNVLTVRAVHLSEKNRLHRERCSQSIAVALHADRVVVNMIPKVEGFKRCHRATALACGHHSMDVARCRPVGQPYRRGQWARRTHGFSPAHRGRQMAGSG